MPGSERSCRSEALVGSSDAVWAGRVMGRSFANGLQRQDHLRTLRRHYFTKPLLFHGATGQNVPVYRGFAREASPEDSVRDASPEVSFTSDVLSESSPTRVSSTQDSRRECGHDDGIVSVSALRVGDRCHLRVA
jgi:hypothetical protein